MYANDWHRAPFYYEKKIKKCCTTSQLCFTPLHDIKLWCHSIENNNCISGDENKYNFTLQECKFGSIYLTILFRTMAQCLQFEKKQIIKNPFQKLFRCTGRLGGYCVGMSNALRLIQPCFVAMETLYNPCSLWCDQRRGEERAKRR